VRGLILAAVVALPFAAFAAEPKVDVQADVVKASEQGNTIDPAELKAMQATLASKKKYGSLQRLSTQKVTLEKAVKTIPLPNGKTAELSLDQLAEHVATVRLKISPAEATVKLGREKAVYQHAGAHEGGDLWLVLSQPK
jgi:hypothetical protein